MSLPLAVTGVKNFLSGAFYSLDGTAGVTRIVGYEAGLSQNPNDLALMLNLLLAITLGLLGAAATALQRAVLLVIALLQAAGVVVTFSRGGFLTLAAIVVLYLWGLARRGSAGLALAGLVACLAGATLLPGEYVARLSTITNIESDATGSAQGRLGDSLAAVRAVAAHPVIGAGAGMNTLALNEMRGNTWQPVHNVYLEYAVDLGVPGLVLFLLLFLACLRTARSVRRQAFAVPGLRELACLAEGVEIALVAFALAAVFHPVAYNFYFYYIAGLAVAAAHIYRKLAPPEEERQWSARLS
jgi:O-antigen ligase